MLQFGCTLKIIVQYSNQFVIYVCTLKISEQKLKIYALKIKIFNIANQKMRRPDNMRNQACRVNQIGLLIFRVQKQLAEFSNSWLLTSHLFSRHQNLFGVRLMGPIEMLPSVLRCAEEHLHVYIQLDFHPCIKHTVKETSSIASRDFPQHATKVLPSLGETFSVRPTGQEIGAGALNL